MYGADNPSILSSTSQMCPECHRTFKSKIDLHRHVEVCVIEMFENETIAAFSDVRVMKHPLSHSTTSQPVAGIVAKSSSTMPRDRVTVRLGMNGEGVCDRQRGNTQAEPETPSLISNKPYSFVESEEDLSEARTIEGPGGIRLMVSVEKSRDSAPSMRVKNDYVKDERQRIPERPEGMMQLQPAEGEEEEELVELDHHLPIEHQQEVVETIVEEEGGDGEGMSYLNEEPAGSLDGEETGVRMGEEEEEEEEEYGGESTSEGFLHMNRHRQVIGALANADDDPFKPKMECPTCGLVLYRHNFSTHFRIHTGELPFACSYCDRRFRTTSSLKVHVRAHTGEKPYSCPTCDYAAMTKRNLDRHIINNHIRAGERKGPRIRKSRYRDQSHLRTENHENEWVELMEVMADSTSGNAQGDHQYGTEEGEEMVEEEGGEIGEEEMTDQEQFQRDLKRET